MIIKNYDKPKLQEMNQFLEFISDLKEENPDLVVDESFVYTELKRYGLGLKDTDEKGFPITCKEFFNKWMDYYKDSQSMKVLERAERPQFCFFEHGEPRLFDYIKLYIPIDKEHLLEGTKQLFDYIESLEVEHFSKVAWTTRSDNVTVRLYPKDYDKALQIIDYVNKNEYIKAGLHGTNPFVPTQKGIGIIAENGFSYNLTLAGHIANYMHSKEYAEMKANPSKEYYSTDYKTKYGPYLGSFNKWVNQNCERDTFKSVFKTALGEFHEPIFTEEQQRAVFVDALKATYVKYGARQVASALHMLFDKGSFLYFSNGESSIQYRRRLAGIGNDNIRKYMVEYLSSFENVNGSIKDYDDLIDEFCKRFFADDLAFRVDEICEVTLMKYDAKQLESAINYFVAKDDYGKFSRFYGEDQSMNCRREIIRMGKQNFIFGMERSLAAKGVDIRNIPYSELVPTYVGELDKSIYARYGDTPKVSKM